MLPDKIMTTIQTKKRRSLVLEGMAKVALGGEKNILLAMELFDEAFRMGSFFALLHGQALVKANPWLKDYIEGENHDR